MDERTKALFADAEAKRGTRHRSASHGEWHELGAVFAIAVVTYANSDDAVLPIQIAATSATIVAYLALGALSYRVAVPHRFRSWMPWAFVTGDAGFLLSNVGLNVAITGLTANYIASLPALWLAPAVMRSAPCNTILRGSSMPRH